MNIEDVVYYGILTGEIYERLDAECDVDSHFGIERKNIGEYICCSMGYGVLETWAKSSEHITDEIFEGYIQSYKSMTEHFCECANAFDEEGTKDITKIVDNIMHYLHQIDLIRELNLRHIAEKIKKEYTTQS